MGESWGVLFLMAMPYVVLASIALWFFRAYRRAAGRPGKQRGKTSFLHPVWTPRESGR